MRRGRVFLYLSLILVLLVVGGYLLYQNFFADGGAAPEEAQEVVPPDTVPIVVIVQKAPRGTVLDETVLGLIDVPRNLYISSMFTDLTQVVGKQAKFDLDSGIPLTINMLVDTAAQLSDAGSVASLSIPEGMVAKSIPISRLASVSYALRPGDRVVVIASMQFIDLDSEFQTRLPNDTALIYGSSISLGEGPSRLTSEVAAAGGPYGRAERDTDLPEEKIYVVPSEKQRPRLATQIIIPSATVLHIGNFSYEDSGLPAGAVPPTPTPIPPQEAVNLTYLIESGVDLSLALRSAGDSTVIDTDTATMQYFLDDYSIPLPAKLPYGLAPRVDGAAAPNEAAPQPAP